MLSQHYWMILRCLNDNDQYEQLIITKLPIVSEEIRTTWSVFAVNRQEVTNTPLASRHDSSDIQSMEQDMAKLPPYVFRRPNGSYR